MQERVEELNRLIQKLTNERNLLNQLLFERLNTK